MGQQAKRVTFDLMCSELRAWLVLTSDDRSSYVIEMHQGEAGGWSADADLPPGEYRGRYYSGDDRNVNYYGAANVAGSTGCGMDAVISIK